MQCMIYLGRRFRPCRPSRLELLLDGGPNGTGAVGNRWPGKAVLRAADRRSTTGNVRGWLSDSPVVHDFGGTIADFPRPIVPRLP